MGRAVGFCSSLWSLCDGLAFGLFSYRRPGGSVTLNIMLHRHWAFHVDCSLWPTADVSVDRFCAVIPRTPCTLWCWLQRKMNVRINGNTVTWPGSLPPAEEGAWVETCYNRLFHSVWRNWTFDRWTSFPLHVYLSNRIVVGKWSRIHKVKNWPGSHTVDCPRLPPWLLQAGGPMHSWYVHTKNGHLKDTSTSWVWPSEILAATSNTYLSFR